MSIKYIFYYSGPPRSPFQSNPLLTAHDYAKSPLMEGIDEEVAENNVDKQSDETTDNSEDAPMIVENNHEVNSSEEVIKVDEESDLNKPDFDAQTVELNEPLDTFSPRDLVYILRNIETDIYWTENKIRDEGEKKKKHRTDDCRR